MQHNKYTLSVLFLTLVQMVSIHYCSSHSAHILRYHLSSSYPQPGMTREEVVLQIQSPLISARYVQEVWGIFVPTPVSQHHLTYPGQRWVEMTNASRNMMEPFSLGLRLYRFPLLSSFSWAIFLKPSSDWALCCPCAILVSCFIIINSFGLSREMIHEQESQLLSYIWKSWFWKQHLLASVQGLNLFFLNFSL